MNDIIPIENITGLIYLIRGKKVIIDRDLAVLYGVETKRLKEQVKRNIERFPEEYDFMYDSISDANEREMGRNPMSKEYIEKINQKRAVLGVGGGPQKLDNVLSYESDHET